MIARLFWFFTSKTDTNIRKAVKAIPEYYLLSIGSVAELTDIDKASVRQILHELNALEDYTTWTEES